MNFQDCYKILKRKRLNDCFKAKKTIKNIMKNFDYAHIDEQLLNYGFERDKQGLFRKITGEELFGSTVLCCKHKKVPNNYELELCMFADIKPIPNVVVLTVIYGKMEHKELKDLIMCGEFINKNFCGETVKSKQTRECKGVVKKIKC